MTREQSDLLDVFRGKPAGRPGGARAVSRATGGRGGGNDAGGMFLTRRQALLGTTALSLFLTLAFVGGLAVGRGRRGPAGPELARTSRVATPTYQVRSRAMTRLALSGGEDQQTKAIQSFAARFPPLASRVRVVAVEDVRGKRLPAQFALVVGGLADKKEATDVLYHLRGWMVDSIAPFEDSSPELERAPPR